jgi:uncharacterized protein (UPF0371 family)
MHSTDTISFTTLGFDSQLYKTLQQQAIVDRMTHFKGGTLYLEIGGKFLYDPHAARVLPGFDPYVKRAMINELDVEYEAIFCINANDIAKNRMLTSKNESFEASVLKILQEYRDILKVPLTICLTMVTEENRETITDFKKDLEEKGFTVYQKYFISGYPTTPDILTEKGFGKDEYIPHSAPLVLVFGPASNSGKLNTCLSQLYLDSEREIESGYAKYELFPIWNLPVEHPVNLAYEAATADIGDYNAIDQFHLKEYGVTTVNYNRDIEAFPIVRHIANQIVATENYMRTYKSPTDMGLNR